MASMISLVAPGAGDQAGTLITIVVQPATDGAIASMTGEATQVGDYPARIEPGRLVFVRGDALVDVHGGATPEQLLDVARGIHEVDDDEWATVVASVGQE